MVTVIFVFGVMVSGVGGISLIIAAFKKSLLCGAACLFLPLVWLAFAVAHWDEAKEPISVQLVGLGIVFLSALIS